MTDTNAHPPLPAETTLAALDELLRPRHRTTDNRFQAGAIEAIETAHRLIRAATTDHEAPDRRLAALDAALRPWAAEVPTEIDTAEATAGYEAIRQDIHRILDGDPELVRHLLEAARDRAAEALRAAGLTSSAVDDYEFREALGVLLSQAARGVLTTAEGPLLRSHVEHLIRDRDQLAARITTLERVQAVADEWGEPYHCGWLSASILVRQLRDALGAPPSPPAGER
ncbi:hypothetical protein AB0A77_28455 [Streptomyces varsoviensis]|uniref:hypothetical protein n=1 Tax=Streptomyces varsoviensis TaxID=67373 RepID=UPI0033E66162